MEKEEFISGFILELRRGTIILCVLNSLLTPTYGYHLIQTLGKNGIVIEANTLYPMLRRLESQGLLESYWNTSAAKPRKYYKTTKVGEEILTALKTHWKQTTNKVNEFLKGDSDE